MRAPKSIQPFLKKPNGPRVTDGELILFIICVMVTTVGLSADIARHVQNPGDLEGDFLSGWHLVLYGGVAAVGACIGMGAMRRGPSYVGAVGTGTIGFLMLGVGGFADAIWHEVFGTEARIEALVSPPHLLVFAGLAFLLTAPIVVIWERPTRELGWIASIAVAVSMVSMLLITSLFTGYLSPLSGGLEFESMYVEPVIGTDVDEYNQVRGLGMIVWTAAIFSIAHAVILMRFKLKPGLILLGYCAIALPPVFLATGDSIKNFAVGVISAGVVTEIAQRLGRPVLGRLGIVIAMALSAMAMWGVTFFALDQVDRLTWQIHLWAGAIVIAGLVAAAAAGVVGLRIPRADELGASSSAPTAERSRREPPGASTPVEDLPDDEIWVPAGVPQQGH